MAQITITLDDTLQDCVDGAISEVKQALLDYLEEHPDLDPDTDETPCLSNDLDYDGQIHQIIDSAVPIYTHEINVAWFLHGDELEEAYENAGVGDNPRDNNGMAAIYFYISEKVGEWYYENAEDIFFDLYEEKKTAAEEELDQLFDDLLETDPEKDELEELDLWDLGYKTQFSAIEAHAEAYLESLKERALNP